MSGGMFINIIVYLVVSSSNYLVNYFYLIVIIDIRKIILLLKY